MIKRSISALIVVLTSFFVLVGTPQVHAQTHQVTRPDSFCHGTVCDGLYWNSGSPSCNLDQIDEGINSIHDSNGNVVGQLHVYYSPNCSAFWGGMLLTTNWCINSSGYLLWDVGNYNTKDEVGDPQNQGCGNWASTVMDEYAGHCMSVWVGGYDWKSGTSQQYFFSAKMIVGGAGC